VTDSLFAVVVSLGRKELAVPVGTSLVGRAEVE
jgi:hypothetical protein